MFSVRCSGTLKGCKSTTQGKRSAALGLVFGEMDAAVHAMHDHIRRSVFLPQARGRGGRVMSAIGPELEITPEQVIDPIDTAAAGGAGAPPYIRLPVSTKRRCARGTGGA